MNNSHVPQPLRFVMTATNSLAHGDAGANSTGPNNTQLFARELTLLKREQIAGDAATSKAAVKALLEACPVAQDVVPFLQTRSGSELIAIYFTLQFPLLYTGEGEGLFSGMSRYEYLTTRLADAATSCSTLPTAWGYVARKLGLGMFPERAYGTMTRLFGLPAHVQAASLSAILKAPELIVMSARLLADGIKASSADYAKKAKVDVTTLQVYQLTDAQAAELQTEGGATLCVKLPAISGNSLRHNLVRAPGATRLLTALGLQPDRAAVPVGVERFLYSGGNTRQGAKEPSASDVYEATVRQQYPFVDALGGSFDMFVLSRSALSIAGWVVCKENNWITERKTDGAIGSQASVFDLVVETTRTRNGIGGSDKDSGQMIYSYETLAAQTQVLIEVGFQPFTKPLTVGVVLQALRDWQTEGGYIGARSAQGHSRFIADFPEGDERWAWADEYLAYLDANKETLAEGLRAAKFGTEAQLCIA